MNTKPEPLRLAEFLRAGHTTQYNANLAAGQLESQHEAICILSRDLAEAIGHLDRVLNGCRTAAEQQAADAAARAWLELHGGP